MLLVIKVIIFIIFYAFFCLTSTPNILSDLKQENFDVVSSSHSLKTVVAASTDLT